MNFNLNILAYSIYFLITAVIIVKVGWMFCKNGAHYLHDLFVNDNDTVDTLYRMLLLGYYLLNLGYVAVSLGYWPHIDTSTQLIELITERTGFIAIGLALMHYINMAWVQLAKRFFKTN